MIDFSADLTEVHMYRPCSLERSNARRESLPSGWRPGGPTSALVAAVVASLVLALPAQADVADIDDSARRARAGDFDASDRIACAQERGEPMGECTASVARGVDGDATVIARFANGFSRSLYFADGIFVSANATMSGSGSDIDWHLKGDTHVIRVDDQRYELPDEFVFGR